MLIKEQQINIFYLAKDPKVCAEYHCDKHVVKMIIEYCQLLSMAVWIHDRAQANRLHKMGRIYNAPNARGKHAHINHPDAIWVRQSKQHFDWLYALTKHLGEEYDRRYGCKHGRPHSSIVNCLNYLKSNDKFPDNGWTPPPQCMPDQYKGPNAINAYRRLYRENKIPFVKYTNRNVPVWLREAYEHQQDIKAEKRIEKALALHA